MNQWITGIAAVADNYDVLLLDLWGVVHDGTALYPGVHETLSQLRAKGKKIIFLSNAPRRSFKVENVLNSLGIEPALYDAIVSSGEVGYHWMNANHPSLGKRYFYIGPGKDMDVTDGLPLTRVESLEQADFLLNVGFGSEAQTDDDLTPLLLAAQQLGLPMICLNPDLEVVKLTGERFPCAGVLAHAYAALGGNVQWFGKPHPAVYEECMRLLAPLPKTRILAVGDSLDTDIPGAQRFGIDSVLVTGGILKTLSTADVDKLCAKHQLSPSYIATAFNW